MLVKIVSQMLCLFSNKTGIIFLIQNASFFLCGQPFCVQIFPKYFFSISSSKIFAAVYLRVCSTGPLTFSHPSASLLELQLNRAIKNVCLLWMINSYQIYARKWNWPNVVSKYLIWNNSYLPKMGDEVVILANSLISHFQWVFRHSAMWLYIISSRPFFWNPHLTSSPSCWSPHQVWFWSWAPPHPGWSCLALARWNPRLLNPLRPWTSCHRGFTSCLLEGLISISISIN